ncbi:hypothetical protein [Aminobacter sp. MET-1]|uniref:hypothetical protein n=1 Tax=Aminobacter sp. MET-1 TaxID=2951085 RepID=UPI00226A5A97|nr:hypothetical protein [Aminobacter sp. MET-1]MCX8571180.1 hypothetical protein [Aminobacter sp. MET-1]MCX8573322.1 hypothetical protein [Aminobacter sp. MET-1]
MTMFKADDLLFGIPTNVFYFVLFTSFLPFILNESAAIGTWLIFFLVGYATVRHRMNVAPAEIHRFEILLGPDMLDPRGLRHKPRI